jgi:hypothetical protein
LTRSNPANVGIFVGHGSGELIVKWAWTQNSSGLPHARTTDEYQKCLSQMSPTHFVFLGFLEAGNRLGECLSGNRWILGIKSYAGSAKDQGTALRNC